MISVIVPVYNCEKYLARSIESILNQSYRDLELLVINDGSTDGSAAIIQQYAAKDNRIRTFDQPNQGVSVARNRGIDEARGEFIRFVDADDTIEPDSSEFLIREMEEGKLDLISFRCSIVSEKGMIREKNQSFDLNYQFSENSVSTSQFYRMNPVYFTSSCLQLFKRELIEKYKIRFAPNMICMEDTLFVHCYTLFVRKGKILYNYFGYNYYQYKFSCSHVNYNLWDYKVKQFMLACKYLDEYLKKENIYDTGGYELASYAWETVLSYAEFCSKNSSMRKKEIETTIKGIVSPVILKYAPMRRKILFLVFLVSRNLFCKLVGFL